MLAPRLRKKRANARPPGLTLSSSVHPHAAHVTEGMSSALARPHSVQSGPGYAVDYDPLKVEPIRAIGAGTIVDIGSWGSYGPWFDYKLADGEFAGKCIYVAEHIGSILPPGTSFNAGDNLQKGRICSKILRGHARR